MKFNVSMRGIRNSRTMQALKYIVAWSSKGQNLNQHIHQLAHSSSSTLHFFPTSYAIKIFVPWYVPLKSNVYLPFQNILLRILNANFPRKCFIRGLEKRVKMQTMLCWKQYK